MTTAASQRIVQSALRKFQDGKLEAAVKSARAGLKKFPKETNLLKILGNAASQSGDHTTAAKAYAELNRLLPGQREIRVNLGIELVHAGKADAAAKLAKDWRAAEPGEAGYPYLMAVAASSMQDFATAQTEASRALDLNPKMVDALSLRGLAHFDLKEFEAALADFETAHQLDPTHPQTVLNIGLCQRTLHHTEVAIETLKRCLDMAPNDLTALANLAEAQAQSGALAAARESYEKLRKADPADWTSIGRLVELNTPAQNQELLQDLQTPIRKLRTNSKAEIEASMAYADLLAKLGKWEEALPHYARSNRANAKARPYDAAGAERDLARTKALFAIGHEARAGGTTAVPRPIFVIGQPRSGTTLTEMMISAHSDVVGLGELGAIEDTALAALRTGQSTPADHAAAYIRELPADIADARAFVDKMPANYRFVGFLAEAFPEARFIHITRDPREVALSAWRRHFSGAFMSYASDFGWMAHAANLYQQYMQHWRAIYPDKIEQLSYQELVEDPEATSKRIAAFCDLDWQPQMAAPEKNNGLVQTASVVQVRQKVHTGSLRSWQKHATLLRPFTDALDPRLWPDVEG